jgi:hypothetical protein
VKMTPFSIGKRVGPSAPRSGSGAFGDRLPSGLARPRRPYGSGRSGKEGTGSAWETEGSEVTIFSHSMIAPLLTHS